MASAEYLWGTHAPAIHNAEAIKTRVFPSARVAVVLTGVLGSFVSAPAQTPPQLQCQVLRSAGPIQGRVPPAVSARQDPTQISGLIFQSLRTPPVTTTAVPGLVTGLAQFDLTPRGFIETPLFSNQGKVPPFTQASQDDPSQRAALVWGPSTPTVITPNPIASFFATVSQFEERPTVKVFPNQVSGQTTPVIPRISASPQLIDLTQQAWFSESVRTPAYALRSLWAAPQTVDLTQQASIWQAQPAAPIIVGVTLYQTQFAGPQVVDLTQQPYFQQAIQNGIVIPVVIPDPSTPGRTGRVIRHDWWKTKEQVEQKTEKSTELAKKVDEKVEESHRVAKALVSTKQEIRETKALLEVAQARVIEEGVKRTRIERAALEKQLLEVEQQVQLLMIQEAVLQEELEVIDLAYIVLAIQEANF